MFDKKQENYQKEIKELKKKCEEYLNGWKRSRADYINFKKEMEKEKEEWVKFANAGLILEMLPIYDHLKTAVSNIPDTKSLPQINTSLPRRDVPACFRLSEAMASRSASKQVDKNPSAEFIPSEVEGLGAGTDLHRQLESWVNGIKQIKSEFQNLFKNLGIEEIKTKGEKFDPELHEAVKIANSKWQMANEVNKRKELKIIKEVNPGYKMHDKVLVPAKVIVG